MSVGFKNAPVLFGCTVVSSLGSFVLSTGVKQRLGVDVISLTRGDVWRLFSSGLFFPSFPQVVTSVVLLYSCRHFERQMGSRKFSAFVVMSYFLSTLTQLGLTVTASSMGFPLKLSSGPYFLVFSLLACYHKLIPKLQPSKAYISSVVFSEKSFAYFIALQLWFSEGTSSFLAGLSGLIAGYLYINDVMGIQKFRLPSFIGKLFSPLGYVFGRPASADLPNGPTPPAPRPTRPGQEAYGQQGNRREMLYGGQGFDTFRQHLPPPPPAPEEAIQTLMNMGFERDRVVRALQSRDNNIEAAANYLLSGNE